MGPSERRFCGEDVSPSTALSVVQDVETSSPQNLLSESLTSRLGFPIPQTFLVEIQHDRVSYISLS